MTDDSAGEPKPKGSRGNKSVRSRSSKSRAHANKAARTRARDPDKSAADKVRSLEDIQRDAKVELILERLADTGEEISQAAKAVGVGRTALWRWRRDIPGLDDALQEAYRTGTESLVQVARNRAVDGWEEPVFHCGKQCGTITKYDHGLLQFLIRKRDPAYRDPKYDRPVTAPRLPGEISLDLDSMPADLLAALEKEAERQAAHKQRAAA